MNSRARTDVDDNRRRRRDRHRPAHAALRARGARRGGSGSASCERPLVLALAPPDLSGANSRVDARPSMKDGALPHCGSDGEAPRTRCGCCGWSCFGARPNFLRTCLPPRDVVDRATERLNPPRFRAICTVAYRSPPAQDCLTSRRSLVRAQYRPLRKCLEMVRFSLAGPSQRSRALALSWPKRLRALIRAIHSILLRVERIEPGRDPSASTVE